MRRIRRDGFGCTHLSLSLYFLHLKFKLGSRGTSVGYKIPTAETPRGIDDGTERLRPGSYGSRAPPPASTMAQLRPDSYGSRAPPSTSSSLAPPGLLREPGSAFDINSSSAPPGLLREPGSAFDFQQLSSARTPTGAELRLRLRAAQLRLTPTGAGLHLRF